MFMKLRLAQRKDRDVDFSQLEYMEWIPGINSSKIIL